jgi:hypothetical protein
MINRKNRKLVTLVAVVLSFCLFALEPSTSAQSARGDCRIVKGKLSDVSNASGTTGRITNGGILNGSTQLFFTSGALPTPDPVTVSYTDDFTVTTNRGVLTTHNIGIFDFEIGFFSEIARIDPNASSGIFAGATGVLFTNGKTTDGGATFESNITGQICLAHDDVDDDGGPVSLVPN